MCCLLFHRRAGRGWHLLYLPCRLRSISKQHFNVRQVSASGAGDILEWLLRANCRPLRAAWQMKKVVVFVRAGAVEGARMLNMVILNWGGGGGGGVGAVFIVRHWHLCSKASCGNWMAEWLRPWLGAAAMRHSVRGTECLLARQFFYFSSSLASFLFLWLKARQDAALSSRALARHSRWVATSLRNKK